MLESPENIKWPPARQYCLGVFPSQSFIPSMPCVCISALKGLYSRLFPETAVELGISLFCHKPQLKAKTEQAITATESLHQSVPEKNTSGLVYTRATNGFTLMSCWLMLSLGMQSLRWLVSAELALLPNPINHRYLYRETAAVCTQPLFWAVQHSKQFSTCCFGPVHCGTWVQSLHCHHVPWTRFSSSSNLLSPSSKMLGVIAQRQSKVSALQLSKQHPTNQWAELLFFFAHFSVFRL